MCTYLYTLPYLCTHNRSCTHTFTDRHTRVSYMQCQQGFSVNGVQPGPVERQSGDLLALSVEKRDVGVSGRSHVRAGKWPYCGRGHRGEA